MLVPKSSLVFVAIPTSLSTVVASYLIVGITMKMYGFQVFHTFKTTFQQALAIKCIGTAVILLYLC